MRNDCVFLDVIVTYLITFDKLCLVLLNHDFKTFTVASRIITHCSEKNGAIKPTVGEKCVKIKIVRNDYTH